MQLKSMFFLNVEFWALFFRIFSILARFWDVPGPPKIHKKSKNRVRDACGTRLKFWIVFGTVLGRFGESLGRVLGRFWEGFGRIFEIYWEEFG